MNVFLIGQGDVKVVRRVCARIIFQTGQFLIGSPNLAHFPQGYQRNLFKSNVSFFSHIHDESRFHLSNFGKGIFQRRTAVSPADAGDLLRRMNVPESRIIERFKSRRVDIVEPAYADVLGIAALCPRDELMRH